MFEVCLFLIICGIIGVFTTALNGLVSHPTKDALRVHRNWCGVCGGATMGDVCDECVVWAKTQTAECERRMAWPWIDEPALKATQEAANRIVKSYAERRRLVIAAGW